MVLHISIREELTNLIGQGRRIEAIKLLRRETHLGLAEAKDVVEQVAAIGPSVLDDSFEAVCKNPVVGPRYP